MGAKTYKVDFSKKFKKEYKKAIKQGYAHKVDSIIQRLANDESLELLIYKKCEDILVLVCFRLGSHSEVF